MSTAPVARVWFRGKVVPLFVPRNSGAVRIQLAKPRAVPTLSPHRHNSLPGAAGRDAAPASLLRESPFNEAQLSKSDVRQILGTPMWKRWLANIESSKQLTLHSVTLHSAEMFNDRVLFTKFAAHVTDGDGDPLPGIVTLRGETVAVLPIATCVEDSSEFVILVEAPAVPIGRQWYTMLPAGFVDQDDNGQIVSAAIRELEEETGVLVRREDMLDLTELAYGEKFPGIYTSPGLLDESVRLFMARLHLPRIKIDELHERQTGNKLEGEKLRVRIVALNDAWRATPDCKLLSALSLKRLLGV